MSIRCLHLLDGDFELYGLTGEILGVIVSRESQVKRLGFASLGAFNGIFEVGQHHVLAKHDRIILGFTTLERHAILLSQKVDHDPIFLGRGAFGIFMSAGVISG